MFRGPIQRTEDGQTCNQIWREEGKGDGMWRVERTDDRALDWSFPELPLHLACTFLLAGLPLRKFRGPVAIGRLGGGLVDALLHPLHDQVEQRYHGLVHLRSRGRTRLEVGNSAGEKSVTRSRTRLGPIVFSNDPKVIRFICLVLNVLCPLKSLS